MMWRDFHDVARFSSEVVFWSADGALALSHPQSELWLEREWADSLLDIASGSKTISDEGVELPSWLTVSTGAGGLLLSDQRSGRWVLLGNDHMEEMARRVEKLQPVKAEGSRVSPPSFDIKGITIRLQSIFDLVESLESFEKTGSVSSIEHFGPDFYLSAGVGSGGFDLRDNEHRVTLNRNEARKRISLIGEEISRLRARELRRGRIRTVIAESEDGSWVLQWGDEVFIGNEALDRMKDFAIGRLESPLISQRDDFLALLNPMTGGCVALGRYETRELIGIGREGRGRM